MTDIHRCPLALPFMMLLICTLVLAAGCTQQATTPPAPDPVHELGATLPPPGELVLVNGSRMHVRCTGTGSPVVVMEAGSTDISLSWGKVQPGVANFTRVCAYDRLGYGWSEPLEGPVTARDVTGQLHSLLGAANITPPYVLVGHSLGGEYVRYYASRYPDDVAGIVLVDPGSEWQMVRTGEHFTREQQAAIHTAVLGIRSMRERAENGTFAANLSLVPADPRLPSYEFHAYQALLAARPSFWEARAVEAESAFSIFSELQQAEITLPKNIPLVVIASGNDMGFSQDPSNNAEANAMFRTLQQEMARESANGTYRVAPNTTHYVQLDRPDIVIEAIRSVVDTARALPDKNIKM
ncbi:alpha/beta fold hydrolase [Methanoregula sp.]|uniref:alpha/beta fold hydrolase n=1 Tax=Methanoregula sp. TaxID=2052170 RepID=UPI0025D7699C|nr:alpha/beta hydrolase [Methanoregula sp.]